MPKFEYKVVPVPAVCDKRHVTAKDQDPVAATLEATINDVSASGWEYVRTDRMTVRRGRLRRETQPSEVMIFRREPYASLQPEFTATERPAMPVAALPDYRPNREVSPRRVLAAGSPTRHPAIAAE